jgi:shikimate dehydrogenase
MGAAQTFALIGHPVQHSPSATIHNAWIEHYGLDAHYETLDAIPEPDDLEGLLRGGSYNGVNLTTPLKERLIGRLDQLDEDARVAGALNTVVCTHGKLHGHNTDIGGFLDAVRPVWHEAWKETDTLILGAGGAARSVCVAVATQGGRSIHVLNRTGERAHALVGELGPVFPETHWTSGSMDEQTFLKISKGKRVVVDATSGDPTRWRRPALLEPIPPDSLWMDLSYWRDTSRWAACCESRGVEFVDGYPMLVHQAARAFQHFTGLSPDPSLARRVLPHIESIQDSSG